MSGFWPGRRCLVTGGVGFGGSHLVLELLRRQAKVCVYDRRGAEGSYLARSAPEGELDVVRGDILDGRLLRETIDGLGIDTVFHLAAQPVVTDSNEHPVETLESNVQGTYTVLEAIRASGREIRMVFASSGAYYGTTTDDHAIAETEGPGEIGNVYAASKIAADAAVRTYASVYGLKTVALRFMNTYGPGDTHRSRLVPRAIFSLLEGKPYDFGDRDDGSTRLDFLYISDMSRAYLVAAERAMDVAGQAFNIAAGRPVSVREVVETVARVYAATSGHAPPVPVFSGAPASRPRVKYLAAERADIDLSWQPKVGLLEGIDRTVAWYRHAYPATG